MSAFFSRQRFGHLFQIQLTGDRGHRDSQLFGIAVERHQQGFVNLLFIQPEFAGGFFTKIGFISIVMVAMKRKGDFFASQAV
ncbi:hypothetical protein OS31_10480 [Dickeya oryzae]